MYRWEAAGDAKAVIVIVHGFVEHQGRYTWLINQWRSEGYHVIMGDLPGHGLTTRARRGHINSFEEYIQAVKEWMKSAYDYSLPIFLLGHSLGGLISIRLLQESELNIAGAILTSPCLGLLQYPPKAVHAASALLNIAYPTFKTSTKISVDMLTRNEEIRDQNNSATLFMPKISVRYYRELLGGVKDAFDNIPDLEDVPIMVMQAGEDRLVNKTNVREWFNYIPCSEKYYKEWPGLYHELFFEPEREDVFFYAKGFVENRLRTLGYVVS